MTKILALVASVGQERQILWGDTDLSNKTVLLALMLLLVGSSIGRSNIDTAIASTLGYSSTNVGGPISTNTTWTLAGSPYIVSADVLLLMGVSLTIEPMVTVKFGNGTSIIVDGSLIVHGNPGNRTTFTSDLPSPARGDWGSIRTRTGGRIEGVEWTTVEYSIGGIEFPADASHIVSDCVFHANGVWISGSNVNITRCTFEMNTNGVNAVNVQVMNSEFYNNTDAIVGSGACAVQNTEVWNNSGNGIYISGPVINCLVHNNSGNGVVSDSVADCLIYGNAGSGASALNRLFGSVVNCSVFNNGGNGIDGYISVSDSSVYNNEGDGVYSESIDNCSIHDNAGNGASVVTPGPVTNCLFFNNKGYGVSLQASSLSKCSVYNNSEGGIIVKAGCYLIHSPPPDSYVQKAQIYNNQVGIMISSDTFGTSCFYAPLHVSDCTINNNLNGGIVTDSIYGQSGSAEISLIITRTRIDSNGQFGIGFGAGSLIQEMSGCTITNNTVGASGDVGMVTGSNITGNSQIGLDVYSATEISGNNIYGNGIYNIKNHLPFGQDLTATENYWGTTNTTLIEAYLYDYYDDYNVSRILFEPFQMSPIPEFPLFLLSMLMIMGLFVLVLYGRKHHALKKPAQMVGSAGGWRVGRNPTSSLSNSVVSLVWFGWGKVLSPFFSVALQAHFEPTLEDGVVAPQNQFNVRSSWEERTEL